MKKKFNRDLYKNEMIAIGNKIAKELGLDKPELREYDSNSENRWCIDFNYYMINSDSSGDCVAGPFNNRATAENKIKKHSKRPMIRANTILKNNFLFKHDILEIPIEVFSIECCVVSYDQEVFTKKIKRKYNIHELLESLKNDIAALNFNI